MKSRSLSASTVVGLVMALGAIPVAEATAPVVHRPVVTTHASLALTALNARWNAEAKVYRAAQARLATNRALGALDARWNGIAAADEARLSAARAVHALDARLNAQAAFFGLG